MGRLVIVMETHDDDVTNNDHHDYIISIITIGDYFQNSLSPRGVRHFEGLVIIFFSYDLLLDFYPSHLV